MLEEIKLKLHKKLHKKKEILWFVGVKEESFKDHVLTLTVPTESYIKEIENKYKALMIELVREDSNEEIEINSRVVSEDLLDFKPVIEKTKTFQEQRKEITTFSKKPNFNSQEEIMKFWKKPQIQFKKHLSKTEIISMPGKYGKEMVASFITFDSRYFTYPNDSRDFSKVDIKIKIANGKYMQYDLFRGIKAFGTDPIGQLNTNHGRVLLAIVHTWQENGCTFANSSDYAIVELSIKELAEKLGHDKMSGELYRWLHSKIEELAYFPNLLSLNGNEAYGFTFLSNVEAWSNKEEYKKTMLRLTFNPFVSRQLYERKAHLRNIDCYKIRNPTAFKFLIGYDKRIIKGNRIELPLNEVVNDLQIDYNNTDTMAKNFKRAFKVLKNYELNKKYNLKVELTKKEFDKKYYIIAERSEKIKQIALA
ncbi:hypothetical protein AGMMS49921_08670 [Endomicrobiia bacterium]|nr:hypothetical protein AGMMS49921_08670 [Endomicrobiia bacterium]